MATARKLPSGSWRVRVPSGEKTENGKYKYKSFTAPSKRQAEMLASQYQKTSDKEEVNNIGTLINEYISVKANVLSPATISDYRKWNDCIKQYCPDFLEFTTNELNAYKVQHVIDLLVKNKLKPRTVHNYMSLIKSSICFAGYGYPKVSLPKIEKKKIPIPTDAEVQLMLKAAQGKSLEVPIMLAAFGPLRRGEICALKWPDDFDGDVIFVNHAMVIDSEKNAVIKAPKSQAGVRQLRMPKKVIDKIREQGYVYNSLPTNLSNQFAKFMKKLKMPYHFHTLRHYCCSRLDALGIPKKEILRRGGWESDAVMENIYNHSLPDQAVIADAKAIDLFDKFL